MIRVKTIHRESESRIWIYSLRIPLKIHLFFYLSRPNIEWGVKYYFHQSRRGIQTAINVEQENVFGGPLTEGAHKHKLTAEHGFVLYNKNISLITLKV